VKRTISARADGAVCIGREAIPVGVFLIKSCTSAVPHNITLFVEFEITRKEKTPLVVMTQRLLLLQKAFVYRPKV